MFPVHSVRDATYSFLSQSSRLYILFSRLSILWSIVFFLNRKKLIPLSNQEKKLIGPGTRFQKKETICHHFVCARALIMLEILSAQ